MYELGIIGLSVIGGFVLAALRCSVLFQPQLDCRDNIIIKYEKEIEKLTDIIVELKKKK